MRLASVQLTAVTHWAMNDDMAARALGKAESGTDGAAPRRDNERATLQDVARAARVSLMTVSNVVNGHHNLMRAETLHRVEREIARLGYRPQSNGRSLRQARSQVVGMLILDQSPQYLADPFITHVVAGMSNRLSQSGYGFLLQGTTAEALEEATMLRDARTDAFCLFLHGEPRRRRAILERLVRLGEPMLAFQETIDVPGVDFCRVLQDDHEGGRRLGEHLLARGARRCVMVVPELRWPAVHRRIVGVRAALRETEVGASLRVVRCGGAHFVHTQAALAAEIKRHGVPDAVLAANDHMAVAALRVLLAHGLEVPGDVLVTGFNGFEFWQFTDPVLTTVFSPAYEMGERGATALLERLERGDFAERRVLLPVELSIGGST
jgi:LacI family transcriptional regulator